jgi:hypothetical protein
MICRSRKLLGELRREDSLGEKRLEKKFEDA